MGEGLYGSTHRDLTPIFQRENAPSDLYTVFEETQLPPAA